MPRLRIKLIFEDAAWRVDLPEYTMVPDSVLPVVPDKSHNNGVFPGVDLDPGLINSLSCLVDAPERLFVSGTSQIDRGRMASLYRGQPKWGDPEVALNI